uniref:Uncharacterized protein n=1 Tax=Tanacetum cinerariifolium TaxID=118510 RepID=A0A6L2MNU9_TANCI|nr:hypothetical protein [Tanacetum cinerariifolium]
MYQQIASPAPGKGSKTLASPLPALGLPVPPAVIEDLITRLGNLEYGHGQLVKKMIQVGAQVEQGQQTATQRDEMIGFAGRGAAERRSDSAATDYGLEDEQP